MSEKKKYTKKSAKSLVKEPVAVYKSPPKVELKIFNSFQEQEDDNYRWLASLTPEQHFQYAHDFIKRFYAKELKKPQKNVKKITIIK